MRFRDLGLEDVVIDLLFTDLDCAQRYFNALELRRRDTEINTVDVV